MAIKVKLLTKIEAAYLAGVVDGEGALCLHIALNLHPNLRYGIHAFGWLAIGGTDEKFISYVANLMNVKYYKHKRQKKHWKDSYKFKLVGNRLRYVLKQILPYLQCKKGQAELLLSYMDLAEHKPTNSLQYWQSIIKIKDNLTILNKKGVG